MSAQPKILGFHWDHNSSVALLEGNEITACASEERYSGLKNDSRFPVNAARYCVERAGGASRLDAVAIATVDKLYDLYLLNPFNKFSNLDYVREQHEYWKPRFYGTGDATKKLRDLFPQHVDRKQYPESYWSKLGQDEKRDETFAADSEVLTREHFGLPAEKVRRFNHHFCHARYALHSSRFHDGPVLVLTVDGAGDGANATINVWKDGKLERHYTTPHCTVGRYYRHITVLLGMKPLEHEYKMMGLAPYGRGKDVERVRKILAGTLTVDGTRFSPGPDKPKDSYFAFQSLFEGVRFDHIAAGVQLWAEETIEQWVRNVVKHFDIDTVVLGGGVAMNVKAMGRLAQLPEVRRFFVAGSSSDDSNSMGAALCWADEMGTKPRHAIKSLYLGPEPGQTAELAARAQAAGYHIIEAPNDEQIARALEAGIVFGRCIGRMEFGQRALGNRSILADPIDASVVPRINAMIKNRDFWMPFAPVVLDSCVERYLINPKRADSPHMTIAYATTPDGHRSLRAACHPADRTARAQILREEDNAPLYALLKSFEKLTGRGGLLNTSFNLHGFPIVRDAGEAYEVFVKTELDALILPDLLFIKPAAYQAKALDQIFAAETAHAGKR